ncbi:MAG: hypothetical protein NNA20_08120 [Nitrospira sp.]|nr:hypothetical protein [Nitrospira sp.]MCP9442546.1 hypothetical protein [Nitrospira sp.]
MRLGTAHAAGRALEETERLRLQLEIRKIDQQVADLYKDIGERAVAMKERDTAVHQIVQDADIVRLVQDVRALKEMREKLEAEMEDIKSEK